MCSVLKVYLFISAVLGYDSRRDQVWALGTKYVINSGCLDNYTAMLLMCRDFVRKVLGQVYRTTSLICRVYGQIYLISCM